MIKKIIGLFLFTFIFIFSFSQNKTPVYRFHSINNLSLLNGANNVSAGLQSVNGFQKANWFAGLGVGLDYYMFRTVPVFADVRYIFGKKKNKFFAYADGGLNICWEEKFAFGGIVIWDGPQSNTRYINGFFSDAGLGYLVKMKNHNALVLSLGQSFKTLKRKDTYTDWRTQQPQTDITRFKLNRIALKIGWQF